MKRINWYFFYQKFRLLFLFIVLLVIGGGFWELYRLWNPGNHQIHLITTIEGIKPGTLVVSPYLAKKKLGFCIYQTSYQEEQFSAYKVFLVIEKGQEHLFTPSTEIWIETNAPSARFLIASLATEENRGKFAEDFTELRGELKESTQAIFQHIKEVSKEEFERANLSKEWEMLFQDESLKTWIYAAMMEEILQRIDFWELINSENLQYELQESLKKVRKNIELRPLINTVLRESLAEGYTEAKRQLRSPLDWIFFSPTTQARKIGFKMFEQAKKSTTKETGSQISNIIKENPDIYKNPAWSAFWELQEQGVARNSLNFLSSLWNNEALMKYIKDKYGIKAMNLFKKTLVQIKENPKALKILNKIMEKVEPVVIHWGKKILLDPSEEQINPLLIALVKEKLTGQQVPMIYVLPGDEGAPVSSGYLYDLRRKEIE